MKPARENCTTMRLPPTRAVRPQKNRFEKSSGVVPPPLPCAGNQFSRVIIVVTAAVIMPTKRALSACYDRNNTTQPPERYGRPRTSVICSSVFFLPRFINFARTSRESDCRARQNRIVSRRIVPVLCAAVSTLFERVTCC